MRCCTSLSSFYIFQINRLSNKGYSVLIYIMGKLYIHTITLYKNIKLRMVLNVELVIDKVADKYNVTSESMVGGTMGKLVVHNHFKEADKEKREKEILQIVVKMIERKNN